MSKYADMFSKKEFYLPPAEIRRWNMRQDAAEQMARISRDFSVMSDAVEIPRRLGGDADGAALALDRKVIRKLIHHYTRFWNRWDVLRQVELDLEPADLVFKTSEQIHAEAATMLLPLWLDTRMERASDDRGRIVTRLIQTGNRKLANKVAYALSAEIESFVDLRLMVS